MNGRIKIVALFLLISVALFSCNREKSGKIALCFTVSVDNQSLVFNEMKYKNALGQEYSVEEVKYFISDLMLTDKEGKRFSIIRNNPVHYVDHGISSTQKWEIADFFPIGEYRSLTFVFGLSQERNKSNSFVNPPESAMAWPSVLGGGYHYMQINGKWKQDGADSSLNIHTGISRLISSPDSLITHKHNYFTVSFSDVKFAIQEDKTTEMVLNMNINQWFSDDYDFQKYGAAIMENDFAQQILKKNGQSVFSLSTHK